MKLGLCHKDVLKTRNYRDLMHFCTSQYFPFYDDEYRRIHYDDDDDHAEHDTQGLLTSKRRYE